MFTVAQNRKCSIPVEVSYYPKFHGFMGIPRQSNYNQTVCITNNTELIKSSINRMWRVNKFLLLFLLVMSCCFTFNSVLSCILSLLLIVAFKKNSKRSRQDENLITVGTKIHFLVQFLLWTRTHNHMGKSQAC